MKVIIVRAGIFNFMFIRKCFWQQQLLNFNIENIIKKKNYIGDKYERNVILLRLNIKKKLLFNLIFMKNIKYALIIFF